MFTKTRQRILSRSRAVDTGRDPGQLRVAPGTGTSFDPTVAYVGVVKNASGLQFTSAGSNGTDVALMVKAGTNPCQVLNWRISPMGLAATVTTDEPTKSLATTSCPRAEGIDYVRSPYDWSVSSKDLIVMADSTTTTTKYWYFTWTD